MVVKHYHFHQQVVSGGSVFPPNILGAQDMSVPPPVTVLSNPVVQSHPRVMPSHPKALTPKTGHNSNKPGPQQKTVVRVRSGKLIPTLWGSSHLAGNHLLGPDLKVKLGAHFQRVINLSEGGAKLTNEITEKIKITMRSHPGPNQVYVIEFGSNNMRKTTRPALEVAKIVSRYPRIMTEAQRAKVRVLLCGTIPDPRPAIDSKLKLLDEALKDLEMGEGNRFVTLRGSMLDDQGHVRKDIFKPNGDIHLNAAGTHIASLRIQRMLETMLPNLVQGQAPVPSSAPVQTPPAPVQTPPAKVQRARVQAPVVQDQVPAPVVVNAPPVVDTSLVAAVIQAPVVASQDQVETPMEEDEDSILERLFFKRFGRALPEKEKEKETNEVDNIKFVIDLTDEDEMEVATSEIVPVAVVKTEPIEVAEDSEIVNVANVNNESVAKRRSSRLERLELSRAERQAITEFGKSLRKKDIIQEKEAPPAAGTSVIADNDMDMSEDTSVNLVESVTVNSVETVEQTIAESEATIAESEAAIAKTDAAIADNQREFVAEFGDTPVDEFDVDIEPLC
jgi:hypothetical protein